MAYGQTDVSYQNREEERIEFPSRVPSSELGSLFLRFLSICILSCSDVQFYHVSLDYAHFLPDEAARVHRPYPIPTFGLKTLSDACCKAPPRRPLYEVPPT